MKLFGNSKKHKRDFNKLKEKNEVGGQNDHQPHNVAKSDRKKTIRRRIIYGVLYATGLAVIIFAGIGMLGILNEDREARDEYDELREIIYDVTFEITHAGEADLFEPETAEESFTELSDINPDFVGWIDIPGTDVNYPVVRGPDNSYYLRRTFRGQENPAGSVFMDYRNRPDFTTPVTTLYGHNMRDGSMFSSLMRFTNETFRNENREIRIVTRAGEILYYEIFAVWRTDAWDDVYFLDFDDVYGAGEFFNYYSDHFLILSTCWRSADSDPDDRFIVAAGRLPAR